MYNKIRDGIYIKKIPRDILSRGKMEEHVEKYIGDINGVYEELIPDSVYVDILVVEPRTDFPFYTLITQGMSDIPMKVPSQFSKYNYAELIMLLPSDWKIEPDDLDDTNNYYPIRILKELACYPHLTDNFLGYGHSIDHGSNFSECTETCASFLVDPVCFQPEFFELNISEEKTIYFYLVIPLFREELEFKTRYGYQSLLKKFDDNLLSPEINPKRKRIV